MVLTGLWTPPPIFTVEEEEGERRTRDCSFTRLIFLFLLGCLIVLPPIYVFAVLGTDKVARIFVNAVPETPTFLNAVAFFAVNSGIIVMALPLWILGSMVVGFTFGFWSGFLINYLTIVFASFVCFTIGRYVFLDSIRSYLFQQRQTRIATRVIETNDFKFLVLFRFMPIPLAIKNYLPACIKVSPIAFLLSVSISAAMFTPLYTFIGAGAKKVANLYAEQDQAAGEHAIIEVSGLQIVIVAMALLAVIATMVLSYFEWQKIASMAENAQLAATPRTGNLSSPLSSRTGWTSTPRLDTEHGS